MKLSASSLPVDALVDNAHEWRDAALGLIHQNEKRNQNLLYGGVALGVLLGIILGGLWWKRRGRASNLHEDSPSERVESLISSCEVKLRDLEQAIASLKANA